MALAILENEVREARREKRDVGGRLLTRQYRVPLVGDLADLGLEEGEPLPDNPRATIVLSDLQPLSDRDRKAGYGGQLARVVGWLARTYAGEDSRGGFVELGRTRGLIREGEASWQARRIWKGPNGNARAFSHYLWDQRYPEISGIFAPRVRKTIVRRDAWPGFSQIKALYKTVREVHKAQILIKTKFFPGEKIVMDLDGKTIEGPDRHSAKGSTPENPKGDGVHGWKLVQGDNVLPVPYCLVVAQTAYQASDFRMQNVMGAWNCVNARMLPNFGKAKPETMRSMGARVKWQYGERLLYVDYFFQWSGNEQNWNQLIRSQKGLWIVEKRDRYSMNKQTGEFTVADDPSKPVLIFVPGKEQVAVTGSDGTTTYEIRPVSGTESRRLFKKADFSKLDSMITWT